MFDIPGAIQKVSELASDIIKRKFPDATEIEKAKLAQLAQEIQNEYAVTLKQLEINAVEAANPSLFVAGWRPACGWVCVSGLVYSFLLQPILSWVAVSLGGMKLPILDGSLLTSLLTAMLGMGVMRSFEKAKGIDTKTLP